MQLIDDMNHVRSSSRRGLQPVLFISVALLCIILNPNVLQFVAQLHRITGLKLRLAAAEQPILDISRIRKFRNLKQQKFKIHQAQLRWDLNEELLFNAESPKPPHNWTATSSRGARTSKLRRFSPSTHSPKTHQIGHEGMVNGTPQDTTIDQHQHPPRHQQRLVVDTSTLWQTYKTAHDIPDQAAKAESTWSIHNPGLQLR
jgi:hypothetical protein